MLEAGGDEYAFQFIRKKISDIEITPAQLALDPCSASAVITDVNTVEKVLVTYLSYLLASRASGTVDEHYNKLNNDQSSPLFNTHHFRHRACRVPPSNRSSR